MGFDDLAKHLAKRDGKKLSTGSADDVVAEAERADRQLQRKRDLILGTILLVGGATCLVLFGLYLMDAFDPKPNPLRPPETTNTVLVPVGLIAASAGAVIFGLRQLFRGLRARV